MFFRENEQLLFTACAFITFCDITKYRCIQSGLRRVLCPVSSDLSSITSIHFLVTFAWHYAPNRSHLCVKIDPSWPCRVCASISQSDYDMVDYLNELRESCLEAYTGIIQGLKGDKEREINGEQFASVCSLPSGDAGWMSSLLLCAWKG